MMSGFTGCDRWMDVASMGGEREAGGSSRLSIEGEAEVLKVLKVLKVLEVLEVHEAARPPPRAP
jgi:hypothetical protein